MPQQSETSGTALEGTRGPEFILHHCPRCQGVRDSWTQMSSIGWFCYPPRSMGGAQPLGLTFCGACYSVAALIIMDLL